MSFIKHGDGKIVAVIKTEDLSEEQKKSAELEATKVLEEKNKAKKTN